MNLQSTENPKSSSNGRLFLLSSVGVVLGMLAADMHRSWIAEQFKTSPPPVSQTITVTAPSPKVAEIVERHFEWAQQQEAAVLAPELLPIQELFAEAQQGTRAFAEDVLELKSKWLYLKDLVSGGAEHKSFLEERFAARVFSPENLEKTVQYAVAAYLKQLDDIDATLLVNLKADLEGLPAGTLSAAIDRAAIEQTLAAAVGDAVSSVEADIPGMIGREVVSYAGGEILAFAGAKLATSAGILSVGTTSGAMTVGAGLILSIIVDQAVSWAYDELFDPVGELSGKLNGTLCQLESLILAGDQENPGLYVRLLNYAAERGQARNAAITSVVMQ